MTSSRYVLYNPFDRNDESKPEKRCTSYCHLFRLSMEVRRWLSLQRHKQSRYTQRRLLVLSQLHLVSNFFVMNSRRLHSNSSIRSFEWGLRLALAPVCLLPEEPREHFVSAAREFTRGFTTLAHELADDVDEIVDEVETDLKKGL